MSSHDGSESFRQPALCFSNIPSPRNEDNESSQNGQTGKKRKIDRAVAWPSTTIKILSATYGPADGRRLLNGEMSCTEEARIPYTRDVSPFLRTLVLLAMSDDRRSSDNPSEGSSSPALDDGTCETSGSNDSSLEGVDLIWQDAINLRAAKGCQWGRSVLPLMEGKSMNALFGDPCPGTTKKLRVRYVFCDNDGDSNNLDKCFDGIDKSESIKAVRMAAGAVCQSTFAEHQRVVLRRKLTLYQDDEQLRHAVAAMKRKQKIPLNNLNGVRAMEVGDAIVEGKEDADEEEHDFNVAVKMGRSQSIAELAEEDSGTAPSLLESLASTCSVSTAPAALDPSSSSVLRSDSLPEGNTALTSSSADAKPTQEEPHPNPLLHLASKKWRLRSGISEIILPIIFPFLEVRQRALCQEVCKAWRFVVRDWGVAQTVDAKDPSFPNFTPSFLRGIMAHSHSSLQSLFLSDFHELSKEDLHPAIPHLRKLHTLDISRCNQLDDSTLHMLSNHLSSTLQVLYLKGLRKVTDEGLISVCRSCKGLRVLEISNVPITDDGGLAIGENLKQLKALYMRDNYLLTSRSVDVIAKECTRLTELTLWGCTRLQWLGFNGTEEQSSSLGYSTSLGCKNLVLLNLWGCFGLRDDAASSFGSMQNLRSLVVSECHKLTDEFVSNLAQHVPHIHNLYLRYCRRITDVSVNAIANNMVNICSLDFSFCTRITSRSLVNLLSMRAATLTELRLFSCHQLDIFVVANQRQRNNLGAIAGSAGRDLLAAIQLSGEDSCLNMLDVRNCCGQPLANQISVDDDVFVRGMSDLNFEQKIQDLFVRPARWNYAVQRRLMNQFFRGGAG